VQQNQKEVPQREEIKEEEDNLNIFYNHVITLAAQKLPVKTKFIIARDVEALN